MTSSVRQAVQISSRLYFVATAFLLTIETIVLSLLIRDSNFVSDTVQCSVCNAIVSSIKATIVSSIAASNDFLSFRCCCCSVVKKDNNI